MNKVITINDYIDGYNVEQFDCISIPIAGMAGSYYYENYFSYCYLSSLMTNWSWGIDRNSKQKNFLQRNNIIMNALGLELVELNPKDEMEFKICIKKSIDGNSPMLLMPRYNEMFYSNTYMKTDYLVRHGIIICGYDEEKKLTILRDNYHVVAFNGLPVKGLPLFQLQLKEDMVYEMWKNSIEPDEGSILFQLNAINCAEPAKVTIDELIESFLMLDMENNNCLCDIINNFNDTIATGVQNAVAIYVRRNFFNSLTAVGTILLKFINELCTSNIQKQEYSQYVETFLSQREKSVNRLLKYFLTGKLLENSKQTELTNEIISNDKKMQEYIHNLNESKQTATKNKVNYAYNCTATADSEFVHFEILKASNAVNGNWAENQYDQCWYSDAYTPEHWWKVDLGQERKINQVVIRHFKGSLNFTCLVNYTIQVSNDDIEYTTIATQIDNSDFVTGYSADVKCRYIKIDITKPSELSNTAIIQEFQAWGYEE